MLLRLQIYFDAELSRRLKSSLKLESTYSSADVAKSKRLIRRFFNGYFYSLFYTQINESLFTHL